MINYILESILIMSGSALAYHYLLRSLPQQSFKRTYLLAAVILALIGPFFTWYYTAPTNTAEALFYTDPIQFTIEEVATSQRSAIWVWLSNITLAQWLLAVYVLGATVAGFALLAKLLNLYRLYRATARYQYLPNGYVLLATRASYPTFSFFKLIFWNNDLSPESRQGQQILAHEMIHGKLGHSFDLLLLELAKVVLWFNPAVYLQTQWMAEIHEFQADDGVVSAGFPMPEYKELLLRQIAQNLGLSLQVGSYFNQSLIKKRITMMEQKTRKISVWKPFVATMLMAGLLIGVACEQQEELVDPAPVDEVVEVSETSMTDILKMNIKINNEGDNEEQLDFIITKGGSNPGSNTTVRNITKGDDFMNISLDTYILAFKNIETEAQWAAAENITSELIEAINDRDNFNEENKSPVTKAVITTFKSDGKNPIKITSDSKEVFEIVEESASPKGGMQEFLMEIGQRVKYPAQAKSQGIEGKVYVQFIVDKDGSLVDLEVVRGIGGGCDEAALEAIRNTDIQWMPGKQKGTTVRQRLILPINFKL